MKKKLLSILTLVTLCTGVNAQNVNIPNPTFKSILVGNSSINTNADTEIQISEAQAFSGIMNIGGFSITDLTGIEAFTSLTELICYGNQLTSLDLSANLALTKVRCHSNSLTSLYLGANNILNELWCYSNQLTSLDVSANTGLTILYCHENNLPIIDVSANTSLTEFYCFNNQLTTLDISVNTNIHKLHCNTNSLTSLVVSNGNNLNFTQLVAHANPDLTCIKVDNAAYSTQNWNGSNFLFDFGISFSEDCNASNGINDVFIDNTVSIYPNPATASIQISSAGNIENIIITSITGEVALTTKQSNVDISELKSGVYFAQVYTDRGIENIKFIKE